MDGAGPAVHSQVVVVAGPADSGEDDPRGIEGVRRRMRFSPTSLPANDRENSLNDESCDPVANAEFGDSGPDADRARPDYWEGYLAGVPALELPTDRPRPAALSPAMGVESCSFPEELSDGLRRLSRETSLEVPNFGLAAFSVLLHRYTAQDKFVVATARGREQLLPVVADFSDQPSFRLFLHRLESAICSGQKVEPVPADLAGRLGIEPDPSRHPIFQVAFSSGIGEAWVGTPATGLDLHLELGRGSQLSARLHFNQDLFDRGTAARMLNHIQVLLAVAIEDIDRSSAELPMLTDRELHELLFERNNTAGNFPGGCLHKLFEATAAQAPNEIAVVHAQRQLSYGELNTRANQLAHYLRKRGIGRNVRVGICLERSLEFAVALLGVLKAGGACVPLDPSYPDERLSLMLGDVAAPIVLTERGLLEATAPDGTQVLHLSREREIIAAEPRHNPSGDTIPTDIAYVIYTSGSTGRPRGVLLPHAGLVNYTHAAVQMFELCPGDRMLQFCSISFDAAIEEIY